MGRYDVSAACVTPDILAPILSGGPSGVPGQ